MTNLALIIHGREKDVAFPNFFALELLSFDILLKSKWHHLQPLLCILYQFLLDQMIV